MQYRYLTTSLTGCVQQLACNILPHGYWFYCMGRVPDKKDPFAIDAKLLGKYGIEISRQQRLRVSAQQHRISGGASDGGLFLFGGEYAATRSV